MVLLRLICFFVEVSEWRNWAGDQRLLRELRPEIAVLFVKSLTFVLLGQEANRTHSR
jgi:hypothetical protein